MPGGVAPKFGSEKVSRYTGVSQLQLRMSRYTVQLSVKPTRNWPFSGLFFDFRVILTSGGHLLKTTLKDSQGAPKIGKPLTICRGFSGPPGPKPRKNLKKNLKIGAEKTMTATDMTGFDAIFSTGFFATFSRF